MNDFQKALALLGEKDLVILHLRERIGELEAEQATWPAIGVELTERLSRFLARFNTDQYPELAGLQAELDEILRVKG